MCIVLFFCCFLFKQKTAYEMRISDWSSDVCSSDLLVHRQWPDCPPYEGQHETVVPHLTVAHGADVERLVRLDLTPELPLTGRISGVHLYAFTEGRGDRKSVV